MPEGWKSISVREDVYEYFKKEWEEHQTEYRIKYGCTTFSGFVSRILYLLIQEEMKNRQED